MEVSLRHRRDFYNFVGFSNINCMNADAFIVLHKVLKRFTFIILALQALDFSFCGVIAGYEVDQKRVDLNRANCK